jgi:hypothetical protein
LSNNIKVNWERHTTGVEEMKNEYKMLNKMPEGERHSGHDPARSSS